MDVPEGKKALKTLPQLISIASDGTYYYIYDGIASTISKIGSGLNGTLPGELIIASKPLTSMLPELVIAAKSEEAAPAETTPSGPTHLTFSSEKKSEMIRLEEDNIRAVSTNSDNDRYCTVLIDQTFPTAPTPVQIENFRGRSYFEITVGGIEDGRVLGLGFCTSEFSLDSDQMLGWNSGTFAYHSDGEIHGDCQFSDDENDDDDDDDDDDEERWPSWSNGDVIGCGIDYEKGLIFYTRNGRMLHNAFHLDDDYTVSDATFSSFDHSHSIVLYRICIQR